MTFDWMRFLVRQTYDIVISCDRAGRYFASIGQTEEMTPIRSQSSARGIHAGGHWYGVKSIRPQLPWYRETNFGLRDLEDGLKSAARWGYPARHRVMRSAAEYVAKERVRKTAA
jgi:hypothetical protein